MLSMLKVRPRALRKRMDKKEEIMGLGEKELGRGINQFVSENPRKDQRARQRIKEVAINLLTLHGRKGGSGSQ